MAIRTGYALPLGKSSDAAAATDMSDFVSGQVPFIFDIGGKVVPEVFIGGYIGFAFGGPGGVTSDECDAAGADCIAARIILGIEAQYHILPGEPINPWLGYGIGLESTAVAGTVNGQDESLAFAGWEFAHFMGGVDFRLSRVFGLGPFLDLSMGNYSTQTRKVQGITQSIDIPTTAMHEWFTLGVRAVFFP